MKTDRTKTNRKKIEKLIRMVWSSLESHLRYCYVKSTEGTAFHMKCVREYALQIKLLSELL